MTVDFLLTKLKTLATNSDTVAWDGVEADLQALVRTESERAEAIFKRYVQACNDAWGPGASNSPRTSDYLDEIRTTSPGKGGR